MHFNRKGDIWETFNTAIINMVYIPKTVMLLKKKKPKGGGTTVTTH